MPHDLLVEGFDKEVLKVAFQNAQKGLPVLAFTKKPTLTFYKHLHGFLKKWNFTQDATKTAIGKFYLAIDPYLHRDMRPDNVYQYIERHVVKDLPIHCNPKYDPTQPCEVKRLSTSGHSDDETSTVTDRSMDIAETTIASKEEHRFEDEIHTLSLLVSKYEKKITALLQQNNALLAELHKYEKELQAIDEKQHMDYTQSPLDRSFQIKASPGSEVDTHNVQLQTKLGKSYSTMVRKLYYKLLTSGIPPGRVGPTIKDVLVHLAPSTDPAKLDLPKASAANYMRREEMKTICDIHKASNLCSSEMLHMNTDGTTLNQRKIAAASANGLVISVDEVRSGSAEDIAQNISRELTRLRKLATDMGIDNAQSINWSVVGALTSDSAATQKKFNRIAEQLRYEDAKEFGATSIQEGIGIISTFCAMHLGINLRTAFLKGSDEVCMKSRFQTDMTVHEFCKLFGHKGIKETGIGVKTFPDFLKVQHQTETDPNRKDYYKECQKIRLARQVGSRYFVTAHNATKILYLKEAALAYLEYFKKNRLENEVYAKLKNPAVMAGLKADGLMFIHIYADLTCLAKSKELKKNVRAMGIHYLELDGFLENLDDCPRMVYDKSLKVFGSEPMLYCSGKLNHRCHAENISIYSHLLQPDTDNPSMDEMVLEKIKHGASQMRAKLKSYAKDQLPGGRYWDPPSHISKILEQIEPSNDICESILGLNDWLQTAMPSASQLTKSNMIEAKKNKTMEWLNTLSTQRQEMTVAKAESLRNSVRETEREKQSKIKEAQLTAMKQELDKKKLNAMVVDEMKHTLVIESSNQFQLMTQAIQSDNTLNQKQRDEKLKQLIKVQLRLRKSMFQQNCKLFFTRKGKSIPMAELLQTFGEIVEKNPLATSVTHQMGELVGKTINHKFFLKEKQDYAWFKGTVLDYNPVNWKYEVQYENEEDTCLFTLDVDWALGDLEVM